VNTAESPTTLLFVEPLRDLLTSIRKTRALLDQLPKSYFRKFGFDPAQLRDDDGRWTKADTDSGRVIYEAAYQGDFHDFVKQQWLDYLNSSGATCIAETRLTFADVTARIDILCRTRLGLLAGIEIKTGADPMLSLEQAFVYGHAIAGAGVSSPDGKIAALSQTQNARLPAMPIFVLYAPGPSKPYKFRELQLEPLVKMLLARSLDDRCVLWSGRSECIFAGEDE
jgi:hypothetical protein